MPNRGSLGATGLRRAVLGAATAGLATCAFLVLASWGVRSGGHSPYWLLGDLLGVLVSILILTAIGATAGLVSGRFRDAPASWTAAVIGYGLAFQINSAIDPSWPTGDSGFGGVVLYASIFLLPFIVGGHLLGARAWAAAPGGRTRRVMLAGALLVILAGVAASVATVLNSSPHSDGYRPASTADVAAALAVSSLPAQVLGLELSDTSTYDSGPMTGRAYYATWGDGSKRQIQVVLNTGVLSCESENGFTDEGGQVTFRVLEGNSCLQVFAPDLPSLRAVVAAVRPGLTAQLEREITNPMTPQPKAPPTE
jgi:hypothetical protein